MDASVAAALEAGRSIIVPSPQRAAALRWNWARMQRARGRAVWSTPDILTWDAWLDARWDQAQRLGGRPAGLRRLGRSQQRRLWEQVLREMAPRIAPGEDLAPHASALMNAAAEATQYLLSLSRIALSDEERLLVAALVEVRDWCERNDGIILPLATPEMLAEFVGAVPPLLAGQRRATPLQLRLSELCWQGVPLLAQEEAADLQPARHVRATTLDAELQACAQWCRQLLEEGSARRLLVISATGDPSLAMQGQVLWRELSRDTADQAQPVDRQLLAVEGGQRLDHHPLVADALAALRVQDGSISWSDLSQLLRSPYLLLDSQSGMLQLEQALADIGTARWNREALDRTLRRLGARIPAALGLAQWLQSASGADARDAAPAMSWARQFSEWLGGAGFARAAALDSDDAQRLRRWSELLDEFAGLDAVLPPLSRAAALEQLQQLASETVHAAESGDAAITLTAQRVAPLAGYDGIWVLGLTEQRWPEPPRPDPYVPLSEQRRCGWDAAGARQRLEQARWIQSQWARATPRLVLSHAQQDGDLRLRPSALLPAAEAGSWEMVGELELPPDCAAAIATRGALPPHQGHAGLPLPRGLLRLRLQQACAFRSQAETRLGAAQPPFISEGIHPRVRGQLLHAVLEHLWQEVRNQERLLRLDETARAALVTRLWNRAVRALEEEGGPVHSPRLLARERERTERLVLRLLQMDADRPPFEVVQREQKLPLATSGGVISVRIDRVDADAAGRWLIDYKSGAPEPIRLEQGSAQPLQLALYQKALADSGQSVNGVALLSLSPAVAGYTGAAVDPSGWPGKWKRAQDWEAARQQWQAEIESLLQAHLAGASDVAPLRDACRLCHLTSLCRRGEPTTDDAAESDDE